MIDRIGGREGGSVLNTGCYFRLWHNHVPLGEVGARKEWWENARSSYTK